MKTQDDLLRAFGRGNVQCAVLKLITSEVAEEAIFTGDEGFLMCSIKLQ